MATGKAASVARRASNRSSTSSSGTSSRSNRNYSANLADGRSVTVRDGVKTYSDRPLKVTGNNGISISGESYSRNRGGTGFAPTAITSESLAPTEKIRLPEPVVPNVPDIAANNVGFTDPATGVSAGPNGTLTVTDPNQDKYAGASKLQNDFETALARLNTEAPSAADVQRQLEKDTGLRKKQQAVNDFTAQLNTIVANRDANKLRIEGQGRGIPEAIIGGQQAQIDKEAAIAALPVQAQLAAAQGNLQLAQDHINTWGQILMKDAENQYTRKKEVLTSVRDFAVGLEFKRIDDLDAANERKYQETRALTTAKTNALSMALGQGAPASVMNAIKSATSAEEVVAAAGIYNGDVLGQAIKREQLNALRTPAPSVPKGTVVVNGKPYQEVTDKEIQDVNDTAIKAESAAKIIDNMITSIKNNGSYVMWGAEKGNRESNRTALLLAMKSLEGTGALDQGTIDVLSGTIPNNEKFANDAGQIAKLNNLKTIITDKANSFVNSYQGTTAEIDARTNRIFQKQQSGQALTPDEQSQFDALFGGTEVSNSTSSFNPSSFY
jgi:hypothetical protein